MIAILELNTLKSKTTAQMLSTSSVWGSLHSCVQHSTAQHSTAQHSTAQHSTAQHSTAQHSTAVQAYNNRLEWL
jgi:hypothetical protein